MLRWWQHAAIYICTWFITEFLNVTSDSHRMPSVPRFSEEEKRKKTTETHIQYLKLMLVQHGEMTLPDVWVSGQGCPCYYSLAPDDLIWTQVGGPCVACIVLVLFPPLSHQSQPTVMCSVNKLRRANSPETFTWEDSLFLRHSLSYYHWFFSLTFFPYQGSQGGQGSKKRIFLFSPLSSGCFVWERQRHITKGQ